MEPLRKQFYRLNKTELSIITEYVKFGYNPISCAICTKELFADSCSECLCKDYNIKDLLIESYIPLVMSIARKLGGYKYNETLSAGLLALTETINHIPSNIKNLTAYVRACVTGYIKVFLFSDTVIRVKHTGSKTHRYLRLTYQLDDSNTPVIEGDQNLVDLYEILDHIPQTPVEGIVLQHTIDGGYSLRDTAKMCNLTDSRISQIKQSLLERVQKALRKELV